MNSYANSMSNILAVWISSDGITIPHTNFSFDDFENICTF